MKRTLLLAYSALLFVYLLPLVFRDRPAQPPRETETAPLLPAESPAAEEQAPPQPAGTPLPQTIRVLCGDEILEMTCRTI